jgi:SOS-response transcriptional repressor LexA
VATETGIEKYVVQRSANGVDFSNIGDVKVVVNGSAGHSYSWIDERPLLNNNYYRIQSVGLNSDTKYTGGVNVKWVNAGMFVSVYPNPTKNKSISLQFSKAPNDTYFLRLSTLTGQTVFSTKLNGTTSNTVHQ